MKGVKHEKTVLSGFSEWTNCDIVPLVAFNKN